ncbi:MAG: CvpA family protein [Limnohabitans sp.]|jgi:membrane protein required for colicin V production
MGPLTLTDGVLGGVLLLSLIIGAWRGLVVELMSLAGWVASFVLAQWLAGDVTQWLPIWQDAAVQLRYALSFALVFVAGMFAAALLSWLLRKVVDTVGLRPADRSLGAIFGLVRGVVVLLVLSVLVHLTGMRMQDWWQDSRATPMLEVLLMGIKPMLPQTLQDFLP